MFFFFSSTEGYRDDSLETVKQNRDDYEMELKILSYEELYGWTMDRIVGEIGKTNNCTFCGVFRRQALDRGAKLLNVNCIATGHNADDIAETVIMNILRGDTARLSRCTSIKTVIIKTISKTFTHSITVISEQNKPDGLAILQGDDEDAIARVKPLKYTYEKEIVMYAHFKKLVYFSTECIFAPNAYRGHARAFLKDLEKVRPSVIMDIIHSGEQIRFKETVKKPIRGTCDRCGFVSSQQPCKACVLLEGLNRGLPKLGIGKKSRGQRMIAEQERDLAQALREKAHLVKNDF